MDALLIPVSQTDELVQVPLHLLEGNLDDIIEILQAEGAEPELWLDFARAYLAQGLTGHYERVLVDATSDDAAQYFNENFPDRAKYARIQGLCSLAAYHAHQYRAEPDRQARSNHLARAQELLNTARKLDHEEQLPHLGIGQLAWAKGDMEGARKEFERAARMRSNGRPSIAGHLALAALQFGQGRVKEALELYRKALEEYPGCPPEVRLGLAACYFKLGNTAKAAAAYERVLELDPGCTQALLGLAVLRLSLGADEGTKREGSRLLTQAFEGEPENPYVLVLLAHFCLQQGFHDKARRLAALALERADIDTVRAEALTVLARALHALGQARDAAQAYQQASLIDPKLPLPRYGLAQMSVLQGQTINAVSALEAVLEEEPGWYDALRILGKLYPRMPAKAGGTTTAQAAAALKAAEPKHGRRAELWEMLGDILAAADPAGALNAYTKAIELYRKYPEQAAAQQQAADGGQANGHVAAAAVPARVLNNAAVLQMRQGGGAGVARAKALMAEALQSAQEGGLQQLGALTQVTLGYNMARVREAAGELQEAEREYKALLDQFPEYADCYLRLACVAKMRGDTRAAIEWAQKASDVSARSADSLALRAGLYLEKRDWPNAKQVLDELLAGEGGGADAGGTGSSRGMEAYGKLCMANLHLYTAPSDRRRDDARHRAENHLSHALELYRRVLEKDPGNVYAANGVGCVLAETGHLNSAKDVFLQVQEASAAADGFFRMPDAWVNLANVYLAQEQYGQAVAMYRNAQRKFYEGRNAQLQLYLARANYDADQVPEAKRAVLKALHLAPTDNALRFDLALCMQECGVRVLNKWHVKAGEELPAELVGVDPEVKLREINGAMQELSGSWVYFNHLQRMGREAGLDPKKVSHHIKFIHQLNQSRQGQLERAKQEADVARMKRLEQQKHLEAAQRQRELEERKRAVVEEAQARAREAQAREHAAKLERLKAEWRDAAVLAKAAAEGDASKVKKGRGTGVKSKADEAVDALFEVDDEDEDMDYAPGQADSGDEGGAGGGAGAGAEAEAFSDEEDEDIDFGDEEEEEEAEIDFGSDEEGGGAAAAEAKAAKKAEKQRLRELKAAKREKKRRKTELKAAAKAAKAARLGKEGAAAGAGAAAAAAAPAGGGSGEKKAGRLKKRARGEGAAAFEGLEDDDGEEEGAAAEGEGPAKRPRSAAALLDDDESEEEGGPSGAGAAPKQQLRLEDSDQEEGEGGGRQQEAAEGGKPSMADLFGSEEEDE